MADENELLDEQVKLLRFSSERASFEMAVTIEEDETLQSGGDAYVTVQVQSQGFVGHNDLWVVGAALASFAADLRALERSLQGEARLQSISPMSWTCACLPLTAGDISPLKAAPAIGHTMAANSSSGMP